MKMVDTRFIIVVFLIAGITQNHGLLEFNLKDAAQALVNTQTTAPDCTVKGRLLTIDEGCGLSKVPVRRIVAGAPAKKYTWPWVALLGVQDENGITFKCGGSLITSRHVLTAARCEKQKANMVRLGEYDLSKNDTLTEDIKIHHFVAHPQYSEELQLNDIAIVHLERDVNFTDRIRPVCLPVFPPIKFRNFDDSNPFLVDWGFTSHHDPVSNIMLQDQVVVLNKTTCKDVFKRYGEKRVDAQYSDRVVCAGIEAEAKCQYDAGSPLVMPIYVNRSRPMFPIYQIGVTTYGYSCIAEHTPGIYASVQYFANWILEELLKKGERD